MYNKTTQDTCSWLNTALSTVLKKMFTHLKLLRNKNEEGSGCLEPNYMYPVDLLLINTFKTLQRNCVTVLGKYAKCVTFWHLWNQSLLSMWPWYDLQNSHRASAQEFCLNLHSIKNYIVHCHECKTSILQRYMNDHI